MSRDRPRYRRQIWLLSILLLGFALRVYRLGSQSLWNDEGNSVALSRLSLPAIVQGAAHDIHPPLYYILLHFWMQVTGDSEFAVRFLSSLAAVLLIAVTYRVAKVLTPVIALDGNISPKSASLGPRVGTREGTALIAAALSAISAMQIYYSQETRMYLLVTLWSALSVWAMVRILSSWSRSPQGKNGWLVWLVYLGTTLAALYTHYFAFTLVLFEDLAFLLWLAFGIYGSRTPAIAGSTGGRLRSYFHPVVLWILSQIIVVAAFLPWLYFAGGQLTSWPAISQALSPLELVSRVFSSFVLGIDSWSEPQKVFLAAFAFAFAAGVILGRGESSDRRGLWRIAVALLWAIIPMAAMFALSLQRPAYNSKFLLLSTPAFFILTARGIVNVFSGSLVRRPAAYPSASRPWAMISGVAVGLVVAFGSILAVQAVYSDPRLQRYDYRGIVSYINRLARPDDAVLVDAPGQMDVFRYYYHGAAQVYSIPVGRPLEPVATETELSRLANSRNIFAVYWATDQADPDNFVERYLSTRTWKGMDEWHGNVRLAQYAGGQAWDETTIQQTYDLSFGDEIQFGLARLDGPTAKAGRVYPIDFLWHTIKVPLLNYKVFVHLTDAVGRIKSQRDTEPVDGFRQTTTWIQGEGISDHVGLLIPTGIAPGDYYIEVGLYRPEDGTRLALSSGGDHLVLGSIRVEN